MDDPYQQRYAILLGSLAVLKAEVSNTRFYEQNLPGTGAYNRMVSTLEMLDKQLGKCLNEGLETMEKDLSEKKVKKDVKHLRKRGVVKKAPASTATQSKGEVGETIVEPTKRRMYPRLKNCKKEV